MSTLVDLLHLLHVFLIVVWLGFDLIVLTEDIATLRQVAEQAGAQIIAEPMTVERPFVGATQAMILRAPGGEWLECLQPYGFV